MKRIVPVLLVLTLLLVAAVGFGSINQFEGEEGLTVDALQLRQEKTVAAAIALPGPEGLQAVAALYAVDLVDEMESPALHGSGIPSKTAWQIEYLGGWSIDRLQPLNCPLPGGS